MYLQQNVTLPISQPSDTAPQLGLNASELAFNSNLEPINQKHGAYTTAFTMVFW